jgi:ATP-dependent RNA helicase DeaD
MEPRPRAERPDMTGSTWFSLSLGRRHRAEPKWVLPLICKAGQITRDDVGAIRIFDEETRFQISAGKSADYWAEVQRNGSGEEGVSITRAGPPEEGAPAFKPGFKHKGKFKGAAKFSPEKRHRPAKSHGKDHKAKKRVT